MGARYWRVSADKKNPQLSLHFSNFLHPKIQELLRCRQKIHEKRYNSDCILHSRKRNETVGLNPDDGVLARGLRAAYDDAILDFAGSVEIKRACGGENARG